MNRILAILFLVILCPPAFSQEDFFKSPERGITSWLPVSDWNHALISGNGTLGAMVFGNPHEETIILSHADLYLPQKKSTKPINQAERLNEIRSLMLQGKFIEASKIPVAIREAEGYTDARDPFIPAFDLRLQQEAANITRYSRTVNFETGETSVNWQDNVGLFQRKVFVSRADSVVILQIKGTGKINATLRFDNRPVEWTQWSFVNEGIGEMKSSAQDAWLTYRSNFKNAHKRSLSGYEGVGRLIVRGGTYHTEGSFINVTQADEVMLLIDIRALNDYSHSAIDACKKRLAALETDYNQLLMRHTKIHSELFNRVRLNLGGTKDDYALNAEEILLKAQREVPLALIEKTFDAGRYNIISSTGTRPPNLQGLWSGTWTAPWTGGFTNDGNLATAISILLSGNMSELMNAFFIYHEKLIVEYRESAKTLYNCRGIHIPAQTTTSGWETDFGETWCLTFWTGAAGWTSSFFYDYYQYTGDKQFLKERAYPFMKEALLFYEDFLTKGIDGKYVFNPSYSPENNPGNSTSQAVLNATMDLMIAKQLLRNCIQSAEVLKVDTDKAKLWKAMLINMPDYQINEEGVLKEWLSPTLTENYKHRHASHLYALYEGVDVDFKNNKPLRNAAKRAIEERMKFRVAEGGGEMAFGLVQLASVAAHLNDSEKAYTLTKWLASKYWSSGFGSFHNVGSLFNTDISGGLPYVITQMLSQSEPGFVSLLPALPVEWKTGTIEGIALRGQVEIKKLQWSPEKVVVELQSTIDQKVVLQLPTLIKKIESDAMEKMVRMKTISTQAQVSLKANTTQKITITL